MIIYCVNLEICDFYIFFFTGIGYTSKKGELILSKKKPPKKTKNKKPPNDVIFQLRKKDMAIYFTIYGIYGEMNFKEL